ATIWLPAADATAVSSEAGAAGALDMVPTVPGGGDPGKSQSIQASPETSRNSGHCVPLSRSVRAAFGGLASLLTAPASSLPLATTVLGASAGGGAGGGAWRQAAGSRQAMTRLDSRVRCDSGRNRTGLTMRRSMAGVAP